MNKVKIIIFVMAFLCLIGFIIYELIKDPSFLYRKIYSEEEEEEQPMTVIVPKLITEPSPLTASTKVEPIKVAPLTGEWSSLKPGTSIQCSNDPSDAVYRYSGNNTKRLYPSMDIWDSWGQTPVTSIDCTGMTDGANMTKSAIKVGTDISCGGAIFRYMGDNIKRYYPSDVWGAKRGKTEPIKVDCTGMKDGPHLTMDSPSGLQ